MNNRRPGDGGGHPTTAATPPMAGIVAIAALSSS